MLQQDNEMLIEQTSHHEVQQKVMQLFAPSNQAQDLETKVNTKLSNLAHNFLEEINASTDINFKSFLDNFSDSQIPVEPKDMDSYLDYLADTVVTHSIHTSSPRFIGHMTSALPSFMQPLAKLMTAMNQNAVKLETAKAISPYERQALATLHQLIYNFGEQFYEQHIQNSQSTLGILVSGGTTANITALWCARNDALGLSKDFSGVEQEGLSKALEFYGYEGAVIIGSDLMHYSFDKAADLLGIGTQSLVRIPTDANNRVDVKKLRQAVADAQARKQLIIAIVGVAGTTDSGGIDALSELSEIAEEAKVHFHVDAAWGGPLIFSRQHRHKLAGIELADSVTIDGHKQLYLPLGIGMVFFRDPHLPQRIEKQASYTMRKGSFDLGKRALEGSRPAMALFLHAGLNLIGLKGYEFLIDEGIRKNRYMAARIGNLPEFELLAEPDMNLLIYRYIPESLRERAVSKLLTENDNLVINQFNQRLQKKQRQAGRTFISRTTKTILCNGKKIPIIALRAVIANPLTTQEDIDAVLKDQMQIALELTATTPLGVRENVA